MRKFKTFKEFNHEKYKSEHLERLSLLKHAIEKSAEWTGKPEQAYQSISQAKEIEETAYKTARSLGEIRVYRILSLEDISRTMNTDDELSVSTEIFGTKVDVGVNGNTLVLSGTGEVLTIYNKDVSTNIIRDSSKRKVPITPLNPIVSEYDEALVIGKDIKWDILYYDPAVFNPGDISKKIPKELQIFLIDDPRTPAIVKRSFIKTVKESNYEQV
jgi:hypothetical protein